eukprot:TRINITY_DN8040_c0_g1_i1.p1 TRINITY_DN8040_c0_g1~~TRINITY_DN8040_c0_g1_i1.p1  ORF type:complete len:536 (-),score=49.85 TRINITY_DN8040_c0_g1_i1:120-1727(-)
MASRAFSHNIVHRLANREIRKPRPNTHQHRTRQLYENVFPDTTVSDVVCPSILMRKFTSDGRYLICFSSTLHDLILYRFKGFDGCTQGGIGDSEYVEDVIPSCADNKFESYFLKLYESPLTENSQVLCKDFCLLVNQQQFLILVSSSPAQRRDPTAPRVGPAILESRCENYIFHLVRLEDGKELDQLVFAEDNIFLPHHAGVSVFDDMFAVMSIMTQTIHIFQVRATGKFVPLHKIGQYCYDDDALVLAQQQEDQDRWDREYASQMEVDVPAPPAVAVPVSIGGLKHRLLSYLHRQAVAAGDAAMRHFFVCYEQYSSLSMWKMQLLDDQHVLIKFGSLDSIVGRTIDFSTHTALFVVYNTQTTEIAGVFTNASEHLFSQFEQFCDFFRASFVGQGTVGSSTSNNEVVREQLRKQIRQLVGPRGGNRPAALKRALASLPMNPQLQQESPYLDQAMFSYDEKLISSLDRPKPCYDQPVRFHLRRGGQLKFKLNTGPPRDRFASKRYASYVFHPVQPFAMSLQHAGQHPPLVNIHFRR